MVFINFCHFCHHKEIKVMLMGTGKLNEGAVTVVMTKTMPKKRDGKDNYNG